MARATTELQSDEAEERRPPAGPWAVALRRLLRKKLAITALVIIIVFYSVALFAQVLAPKDFQAQDLDNTMQGPSIENPLGTDRNGRDMLSRVIWASRTTAIITVATVVTGSLALGVGLGLLSGYAGGKVDTAIMRSGEVFASLPGLPMLILINATMRDRATQAVSWLEGHFGGDALLDGLANPTGPQVVFFVLMGLLVLAGIVGVVAWLMAGEANRNGAWLAPAFMSGAAIMLLWGVQGIFATPGAEDYFLIFGALSLFSWVGGARVIRSQVLALRETEYVTAARAMGASTGRILWSHLLPNVSPIIIVSVSAGLGAIAGSEIALTFLGVGVHEPTPSFGAMIFEEAGTVTKIRSVEQHMHLLLVPAVVVGALIFSFNLFGDALNDVLTPRAH